MQLKKEILLFCSLGIFSICLLIAADFKKADKEACIQKPSQPVKCCEMKTKITPESPLNFIARGILHISS
ncbi:MAG TPA: hypothetical protein PLC48_02370 [Ferruginibacter sp.]|nr:hypothetical protein [Ferruginibacter sp.]